MYRTVCDVACLVGRDDSPKYFLQPVCEGFGNHFVVRIEEADGAPVREIFPISFLLYQANDSGTLGER